MSLYKLSPEVAGGFGENSVVSNIDNFRAKREKPIVSHLHYEFSGWLGDEILETTPCFIVTESLADTIQRSELKGYTFADVETSTTEEFEELYPGRVLPNFKRIMPQGTIELDGTIFRNWSGYDFCLSQRSELVVTEKSLEVLLKHKLDYCDIVELKDFCGR